MSERDKMGGFLDLYREYNDEGARIKAGEARHEHKGAIERHEAGYMTRDELAEDWGRIFDEYVATKPADRRAGALLAHFCGARARPLYIFGLREAFMAWDMRHLLNVIHQSSRCMSAGKRALGSGCDHSANFMRAALAFAANDAALAKALLPRELGPAKNGHPACKAGANLMMSLMHGDGAMLETSREAAVRWMSAKRPVFEKSMVGFLLALCANDMPGASECLKRLCEGTRKIADPAEMSRLEKCFCGYAHGLYNFAGAVLPAADFGRIEPPDDKGFIKEFARWNVENGFPGGDLYFAMPGRLASLDAIARADPPAEKLRKASGAGAKFDTDHRAFSDELTARAGLSGGNA